MDGDLSALPPSAALPPIDPSSSSTTTTTAAILPLSAPPFKTNKPTPAPTSIPSPTPIPPTPVPPTSIPPTLAKHTSLLSPLLHTRILALSDEFFAPAHNLISPFPPVRKPGVFVETGAWFDGWETRRHNRLEDFQEVDGEGGKEGGGGDGDGVCDWVIFALGCKGVVKAVEVDTAAFVGNQGEWGRVVGVCESENQTRGGGGQAGDREVDATVTAPGYRGWNVEILPRTKLEADTRHIWLVHPTVSGAGKGDGEGEAAITHVKLQMFPDGGIARFRLYGDVVPDFPALLSSSSSSSGDPLSSAKEQSSEIELSATLNAGVVTACSDEHFGKAANLLLPGRGTDMGDGWETKRSRGVRHEDWVVVRLGARGRVGRVVVDTLHFRGNFPRSVRVEGMDAGDGDEVAGDLPLRRLMQQENPDGDGGERAETGMAGEGGFFERDEGSTAKTVEKEEMEMEPAAGQQEWKVLGLVERCEKDKEHEIVVEGGMVCTHAKMVMIPDGGVKRFRVFGTRV